MNPPEARVESTLALCGDVMTGRGVDQILPHPGPPRLAEAYVRDARDYVTLAERVSGAIPRPVHPGWPWGHALSVLDDAAPDVFVINLETSITRAGTPMPGKAVHYRMAPENIDCLTAAHPDVCALANNHVLDYGPAGLADTLDTLAAAGLSSAGAGQDAAAATRPAIIEVPGAGRVIVAAGGTGSSGIPTGWTATEGRPGVALLPDLSDRVADRLADRLRAHRRPGDLTVASIHWGSNWGYDVPAEQVRFAHRLIDRGVDLVHGHSSHHPRPIEVYRDRLVLYGTGDFIDDYEGITGHEPYRGELRLLYLATLSAATGALIRLRMVPLRARRMRLRPASATDTAYLRERLDQVSRRFGVRVGTAPDGLTATG